MKRVLTFSLLAAILAMPTSLSAQYDFSEEPIRYYDAEADNVASRLQQKLDLGDVQLVFDEQTGYLRSLLNQMEVPISSQGLVFSKTSLQLDLISPRSPRAIYFNDNVYVGFVPHGRVLEVSAVDPKLGAVFYTLGQTHVDQPRLVRRKLECTQCHTGTMTQEIPGHTVRSVFAGADGRPQLQHGSHISDDRSPLRERWGGWYVTGSHGKERHMGNNFIRVQETPETMDLNRGANVTTLGDRFDTDRYLSPHSDITALMVLEHQTQVQNSITKAHYQAIWTKRDAEVVNQALNRPVDEESESTRHRYDTAAERLLKRILLVGEVKLLDKISGESGFASEFAARGPHDTQGRSLRDLDLKTRLFRYPCSYLIYSEAFESLPTSIKDRVYRRLWEVITGLNQEPEFAHLNPSDRQAILEIVRDTKANLPDYWHSGS